MVESDRIGWQRMVSQRIAGQNCGEPVEVVRWMGAMQAQEYGQLLWAIGLRTTAASRAMVERAFAERQIVITWPMRGTLHCVPAEDARWMLRLLAPRMIAGHKRVLLERGLDEVTLERSQDLFRQALGGGRCLTRASMLELLRDAGIDPVGQRGYSILVTAAQAGVICLGPVAGKQQTFVLLDEWVPQHRDLAHDEALATLATRYFVSHGPVTLHDFARWASLTIGEARHGLSMASTALSKIELGTQEYWLATEAESSAVRTAQSFLLPGFDEYILGYKNRDAVLDPAHSYKVVPGNNGIFMPIIVQQGQVIGTWKRQIKKSGEVMTTLPFAEQPIAAESLAQAVQRYSDFCGVPVTLMAHDQA